MSLAPATLVSILIAAFRSSSASTLCSTVESLHATQNATSLLQQRMIARLTWDEPPHVGTEHWINITSDSKERRALLHLPPRTNGTIPLVFDFHPMGQHPDWWKGWTIFNKLADEENFAVVYPQGYSVAGAGSKSEGYTWNAGSCCPNATIDKIDDVRFTKDLLAHIKLAMPNLSDQRLNVDSSRVYATGMSNGGFMVHRLACEEPDLFAAISSATAVLANWSRPPEESTVGVEWPFNSFSCAARARPVPTLLAYGTWDVIVRINGNFDLGFRSANDNVELMKRLNGIPEDDKGTVSYRCCGWFPRTTCTGFGSEASNVTICKSKYMGHMYPVDHGRCTAMSSVPFAWCTRSLPFTRESWNFFKRYRLPSP